MAEQNDGLEKSDAMAFDYSTLENQPGIVSLQFYGSSFI